MLTEGRISNVINILVAKFAGGNDLRDISPELAKLASKDKELNRDLKLLQKATVALKASMMRHAKANPEVVDLEKRLNF